LVSRPHLMGRGAFCEANKIKGNIALPWPWWNNDKTTTRHVPRTNNNADKEAAATEVVPTIGILACPNLPQQGTMPCGDDESKQGCVFVAISLWGCYQLPLQPAGHDNCSERDPIVLGSLQVATDKERLVHDARFCIGVERYSDALGQCSGIARFILQ